RLPGQGAAEDRPMTLQGRVRRSLASWCYLSDGDKWSLERLCEVAKLLDCPSVELVAPEDWGTLKKHGLVCAIAPNGMPGAPFMKGLNNPRYQEEVITRTKKTIDACAEAKFANVIAFTGYQWKDADDP